MFIPKIIHQLWIGDIPPPINLMNTWKEKNPEFEYIFWNEEEFKKRNITFKCQEKIEDIEQICGKVDIMRWELLYKYGGIFIDADSICIEPLDELIYKKNSFAGWEHEIVRPGLIAIGTMGFSIKHPLIKEAINWIYNNEVSQKKTFKMAWQVVGPCLLTALYNTGIYNDIYIFPSYYFLPIHHTKKEYNGHGKIYAYQVWGSTNQNYETMNNIILPEQFQSPPSNLSISILISSYNTKESYIQECLESIKNQEGYFNIELIWINDGSDEINSKFLRKHLKNFKKTTRFCNLIYVVNNKNRGIGYSLNKGVQMCSNDIIIKMDSDDIMFPNRINKQLNYMLKNPEVKICGAQIHCFKENINNITYSTKHPSLTWDEFKVKKNHWITNHPTLCYRKSAILEAGNYDLNKIRITEDFEFILRMLKKYEFIHNMEEVLLYYRLHENQVTHQGGKEGRLYWNEIRNKIIENLILD